MAAVGAVASAVAKAVLLGSLATLGVWVLWYGQYQWESHVCKTYRRAYPGGAPAAWVTNSLCALNWSKPVLKANIGFLVLTPAVAALSAIAVIALRQHGTAAGRARGSFRTTVQSWLSMQLPPTRFWLWLCDGLTLKDAAVVAFWAAFNTIWYHTILSTAFTLVPPGTRTPRVYAKSFAGLMSANLVLLFFPVSRGSVINNAIGLSYPEGIRYHRWLGQWVLLLISLHGLIYWISWTVDGHFIDAALRPGGFETNNRLGGPALFCALLLWTTSQERVRRWWYAFYKVLHFIGFWGFLLVGCMHHWGLFWSFVPGLLLYAVDGVFRLHQMFAGRSGNLSLSTQATAPAPGCTGTNTEVLRVDVDPANTMCSLLLAAPEFGATPAGVVWLNVPAISLIDWHAFDYTASQALMSSDGTVCNGYSGGKVGNAVSSGKQQTALLVHIKAYSRWTKSLVTKLAAGEQLTIRLQGPYADPPVNLGQPDAVVLVAGGNGIASALPVFEQLSEAGVHTQGLPALLLWACRKGHEFEFMAPRVMAAAKALGLQLTVRLHATDETALAHRQTTKPEPVGLQLDAAMPKDISSNSKAMTLVARSDSASFSSSVASRVAAQEDSSSELQNSVSQVGAAADVAHVGHQAGPTGLCPLVGFSSFAGQLSFKAILHLAVFGGALLGIFITSHVAVMLPIAAGSRPWETLHLGPTLVLITAGCAVGLGLITLWIGLLLQRRQQGLKPGPSSCTGPAAAMAAASGKLAVLMPSAAPMHKPDTDKADFMLEVPSVLGDLEVWPVFSQRPEVEQCLKKWLTVLQQLPAAATAAGGKAATSADRMRVLVYGCGPTQLDHATQLAVSSLSSQQRHRGGGSIRPLSLQFIRKAQQL